MASDHSPGIIKQFAGKGVFPHQLAFTLLFPGRNIFLSPRQLIARLDMKKDSRVLEVGPGPGYFSSRIAEVIVEGKLVLADIQQEMLNKAKKRMDKREFTNVEYYLCDGQSFQFPDESFNIIFLVTVIGEIENKETYIKEFHRLLSPGGILSISELKGDPDKMKIAEVKELALAGGFTFERVFGNEKNYTINFKKSNSDILN